MFPRVSQRSNYKENNKEKETYLPIGYSFQ